MKIDEKSECNVTFWMKSKIIVLSVIYGLCEYFDSFNIVVATITTKK